MSAMQGALQNQSQEPDGAAHWQQSGVLHFILILACIVAADVLFYKQPLGCTVAGYGALLLLAVVLCHRRLFVTCREKQSSLNWPAVILAIALFGLIVALLESPGILPVVLGGIGLITLTLIGREGWVADAGLWIQRWFFFMIHGCYKWFTESASAVDWCKSHLTYKSAVSLLRKWAIPLALSLIFIVLFAIANPIIELWVVELQDFAITIVNMLPQWPESRRMLLWFLVGIWVVALLRLKTNIYPGGNKYVGPELFPVELYIRPDLIVRCLVLFNAVFAVETLLDILYLWGGARLPHGMTYATYAHRGAYPLVATVLLAALFVLVTFRRGTNTEPMRTARKLVYLWLAQNAFLVMSAAWRLHLYVEVYSFTRLRVAAAIWMALVVMGLIWISWRIVAGHSNQWLINVNLLTLLTVLYVCPFVNFDGVIASYNVRHCREVTGQGVPIDLGYLRKLGPESLSALRWLVRMTDDRQVQTKGPLIIDELKEELARVLGNWRGWCYRRHRLARQAEPQPAG